VTSQGYLLVEDVRVLLSYAAYDASSFDVRKAIERADNREMSGNAGSDGILVRWEFIELCIEVLWPYSLFELSLAIENYHAVRARERDERKLYFREIAQEIDRRFISFAIPMWVLVISVIFNTHLEDEMYEYSPASGSLVSTTPRDSCLPPRTISGDGVCRYDPPEMFQGVSKLRISTAGILIAIFLPLAILSLMLSKWGIRRLAKNRHLIHKYKDVVRANWMACAAFETQLEDDSHPSAPAETLSVRRRRVSRHMRHMPDSDSSTNLHAAVLSPDSPGMRC